MDLPGDESGFFPVWPAWLPPYGILDSPKFIRWLMVVHQIWFAPNKATIQSKGDARTEQA